MDIANSAASATRAAYFHVPSTAWCGATSVDVLASDFARIILSEVRPGNLRKTP